MKTIFLILLIQLFISFNISAQLSELGITIGNNFSSHTNSDPTIPEDGQFQWDNLSGINVGVYASKILSKRWEVRSSVNFQNKGYTELAQTGTIGSLATTFSENRLQNRLSYLTLSIFADYIINPKSDNLKFAFYAGLENNFMVNNRLESTMVYPIFEFYPVNEYQDNWNTYYLNYNLGCRIKIDDRLGASAFFNRSINPVLKTDNLIVKDWIWGLSLDLNLLSFLKR